MDIVNPAFARMFSNNPLSALFKPLSDLAMPEHAATLAQAFQDVVETRHPKRLEITVQYLSSNPFDVDVLLSPIVEQDGALSGVVCSLRDNSERKRTEAQLRQLLQHEMELSEIQSRYVSMAAHDLRNPLAVIQAVVGTLQRHGARLSDEEKQAKYDLITRNIRTMDDLLNDVLTMGKIESGKRVFEPASLNVSTFCQNLVSEFQQTIDSAQRIIFSHTGNNNMVNMDAKLLHHILENLLSNAMKYSPPDSPVIFTLSSSPETVTFRIEDHGIGIPQEDQARLFEAFHRAKNTRKIPGTGLGLAIVKQAIELHNGTITCETTENVGTTFTVVLPVN
jgi:signal transduction histidine kinase